MLHAIKSRSSSLRESFSFFSVSSMPTCQGSRIQQLVNWSIDELFSYYSVQLEIWGKWTLSYLFLFKCTLGEIVSWLISYCPISYCSVIKFVQLSIWWIIILVNILLMNLGNVEKKLVNQTRGSGTCSQVWSPNLLPHFTTSKEHREWETAICVLKNQRMMQQTGRYVKKSLCCVDGSSFAMLVRTVIYMHTLS